MCNPCLSRMESLPKSTDASRWAAISSSLHHRQAVVTRKVLPLFETEDRENSDRP